ncbi:Uncharacterized protein Fot_24907 [Forsythia ovata]|uniref:Uncharacterized protein n=1 Tax=Forsythia ovata TaxID=205694 RepID=A0ABD1U7H9_9LAMI
MIPYKFIVRLLTGKECISQRISQISSASIYSISDDLASGASEMKMIEHLFDFLVDSTSENKISTPNKTPTKQSTSNKVQESSTVKRGLNVILSTQMSSNKTGRIVKEDKN